VLGGLGVLNGAQPHYDNATTYSLGTNFVFMCIILHYHCQRLSESVGTYPRYRKLIVYSGPAIVENTAH
jgi:hypothetical protein